MKKVLVLILALALGSIAVPAFAQRHDTVNNPQADTPGERNLADKVDIVGTPQVQTSASSAQIHWQTNNEAATDVWLQGPGINGHRADYQPGGHRDHNVSFNNLRPNTTYTFLIRARDGVRYTGTFTTR